MEYWMETRIYTIKWWQTVWWAYWCLWTLEHDARK